MTASKVMPATENAGTPTDEIHGEDMNLKVSRTEHYDGFFCISRKKLDAMNVVYNKREVQIFFMILLFAVDISTKGFIPHG